MNVSIKMGLIVKRESVNVKFIWNNPVVKGMSILVQNYKENHFHLPYSVVFHNLLNFPRNIHEFHCMLIC